MLTLTNVTGFRASVDQAIHERGFTKAILNTVIDPLVVLDAGLRVQTANRAFYTTFQVSRDERLVEGGSKWRRGAAEFGGAGSVKVSEGQGRCRGRSLSRSAGGLNPSGVGGVWRPAGGSSRPWSPGCGSGA